MTSLQRFTTAARKSRNPTAGVCWACATRAYTKYVIKENDVVVLKKSTSDDRIEPILSKPLKHGTNVKTPVGSIPADEIIGKSWRDVVVKSKGKKETAYRILQPTMGQFVELFPRIVTPIYPRDANLIVSLLDLHPTAPNEANKDDRLEIFEAGTGHGGLTLHLARAIHAANTAAPPIPLKKRGEAVAPPVTENDIDAVAPPESIENIEAEQAAATEEAYKNWMHKRRAVIHTLDAAEAHSLHAQRVVRSFRDGIYFPHVDFHVGGIPEYLTSRLADTKEPFLEHAILDLPGIHDYLEIVGKALRPNGILITFCPSITQVLSCVHEVKDNKLPFLLEKVLETGISAGVGGREWDVRTVRPKALVKAEVAAREQLGDADEALDSLDEDAQADAEPTTESSRGWEAVCRPKVAARVTGGGFVGVWRRME
ncbi:hypothetical protein BP6252_07739 [Coleophoma cylindrospora]|uniref:tRNA (adenine(58)-N(1))-methyltransferase catalytic subunit TRM61 n=1 Tax=Coleophoma cylindrospora TaxID=1849047 RepID=A0A3D8RB25_9HELO|nr:hypothetical protein BP6252_07739 [Coleophoma cylindrospora]